MYVVLTYPDPATNAPYHMYALLVADAGASAAARPVQLPVDDRI